MLCGPASPMCAVRMDGVVMAADHCSGNPESHNRPCSWDAWVPHQCSTTCGGVGGPAATHGTDWALLEVLGRFWAAVVQQATSAKLHIAVMVGRLRIRWATKCLCWSLVHQSSRKPRPHSWFSPRVLILHPCRDGRLLVQPTLQVGRGQLAVVPKLCRRYERVQPS